MTKPDNSTIRIAADNSTIIQELLRSSVSRIADNSNFGVLVLSVRIADNTNFGDLVLSKTLNAVQYIQSSSNVSNRVTV